MPDPKFAAEIAGPLMGVNAVAPRTESDDYAGKNDFR